MTKRWKFLRTGNKSEYGNHKWVVGKWYEIDQELDICSVGFHCSKGIWQAFSYVQGEILAEVEVGGKSIKQEDKEAWEKMRIVKTYRWVKKDSVLFSIYAAKLVLKNYEDIYPDDDRPRKAIEAAEKLVKNPTKKNQNAAESAAWSAAESAAWSAVESAWSAAESAAWSAAESAWSAARSAAWSAARSAAESARSAAESAARSAAESAAWSAGTKIYKKLDKWMLEYVIENKINK